MRLTLVESRAKLGGVATKPVTLDIGDREFRCVPLTEADFIDQAAIYVILCVGEKGKWRVLDVGQSGELGTRIESHDRRDCWEEECATGNIWVCVYPMPSKRYSKQDRLNLEAALRRQYDPPCGKR